MQETKPVKTKKFFTLFTVVNIVLFLAVIAGNFYFFYFKKDFKFFVEVPCDENKEQCFKRDCANPDDCPPNGLTSFKRYSILASDFKYCRNEDCAEACKTGLIKCEQIACSPDAEAGETCASPAVPTDGQGKLNRDLQ